MTEPDTTTQEDEVDDGSEQILSTETNSMPAQVKRKPINVCPEFICENSFSI